MISNNSTSLYQVKQIQKLEELAIKKYGVSIDSLMERAGKSAFVELKKRWPKIKNITVVCGKGNNAGDGYVVAYLAKKAKFKVKVLQLVPIKDLSGAAKKMALKCKKLKVVIKPFSVQELKESKLIVDAILGTGLKGGVKSDFKKVIKEINSSKIPIFSLDLPSGIDADMGRVLGEAVCAEATITFLGNKIGLLVGDARDHCGEVIVNNLELPAKLFQEIDCYGEKLNLKQELKLLKPRKKNSHKGDFGHVLIIGGDLGMNGAVRLAAEAALRVGAGLVTVATRKEHVAFINVGCPEIMAYGVSSKKELKSLLEKASVVVIGPGLGKSHWAKSLFSLAIKSKKPLVIDADGLNILAVQSQAKDNWILTPHPGEAARLLKIKNQDIQFDRIAAVKKLQKKFGGVSVLKGSGTLLAASGEKIRVCDAGNPGMASAGMGDVLTGIIAGLLAQNLSLFNAAKLGVLVHALAGDLVADKKGLRGMVASDLIAEARNIINLSL